MESIELLQKAKEVSIRSYSPYSNFKVGAALLATNGKVYLGTNIENVSLGATICAERSAVASAISSGVKEFEKIAIIADTKNTITPCGICRQFLMEFNKKLSIICSTFKMLSKNKYTKFSINDLLPEAFNSY